MRNIHFRRQYAIGKYVVDFCAPKVKLIIEVVASQHLDLQDQDDHRTSYLVSKGYHILRFWNNDVTCKLDRVLSTIEQTIVELINSI